MKEQHPPSVTFKIDGDAEGGRFTDVYSTADHVYSGGSTKGALFERIWHEPVRLPGGVNWTKIGAIAGVFGVIVAVVALAVTQHWI